MIFLFCFFISLKNNIIKLYALLYSIIIPHVSWPGVAKFLYFLVNLINIIISNVSKDIETKKVQFI